MEETQAASAETKKDDSAMAEEAPITVRQSAVIGGVELSYSVTTGRLPLKNDKGEIEAQIFFMAYTRDFPDGAKPADRPLMFSFNGGPGSSSVWLHLGAVGPKLAAMNPDGTLPPPPYPIVDNPHSWLSETDLVFIDPVGTGFSRAKDMETAKKFWGVEGDLNSLAEFIRLYLTRFERWGSPLYMVGESYGTTRGAGLAGKLVDMGIALSGLLLVSTILNFQTARFSSGNDLPYLLFLPTYAAIAHYHGALSDEDQSKPLTSFLAEVEAFVYGDYALALMRGDRLPQETRVEIARTLSRFTGLSEEYVDLTDLRPEIWRFCKELLRRKGLVVGRLDGRLTGREGRGVSEGAEFDPSMSAIRPPYTAVFNDYVRRELGYKTDLPYEILGGLYGKWDWGPGNNFTDTSVHLRQAITKNPHLKVFVASGYYDLATPYAAAEYTFAHMGLPPEYRDNLEIAYYEAGHMMYIESGCLEKLKTDVAEFLGR
jgi:carboxypeptidase C (cathepsin A)